jgi:membrane protein YdbS with pleckstrin-like domain
MTQLAVTPARQRWRSIWGVIFLVAAVILAVLGVLNIAVTPWVGVAGLLMMAVGVFITPRITPEKLTSSHFIGIGLSLLGIALVISWFFLVYMSDAV